MQDLFLANTSLQDIFSENTKGLNPTKIHFRHLFVEKVSRRRKLFERELNPIQTEGGGGGGSARADFERL